jgi:hypothetical protein
MRLVFAFLSDEHLPPHVHVTDKDGNQSIFDLIIKDEILVDIVVRNKVKVKPISERNQGIVKSFIRIYYAQIVAKWVEHFILHKKIKSENIKKIENLIVDTQELVKNLSDLNALFYPSEKKQPKPKKK